METLKLKWKEHTIAEESATELATRFTLDEAQSGALDIANNLRGKRILLAEDARLREAAEELGVATLTFAEVAEAVAGEAASEAADESDGGSDDQGA
jgi:hypothetical protein